MQKTASDFNSQQSQYNHNNNYEEQDEQDNLVPQPKQYQNHYEQKPENQLESIIMEKIHSQQKQQDLISKELEVKLQKLNQKILFTNANQEEKLKLRMHQLALSKILVNTHGKTDFYLVKAHHHLGQAYLNYKCFQQALDHLTMSLKKNAKINDMNQIKLYHSYVLTTYSRCYFEISSFDDALEILKKAYDIQIGCQNQTNGPLTTKIDNFQTLKLISNCYLKLKNYQLALQYIQKALLVLQNKNGKQSKQYAKGKVQKSKILIAFSEQSKNQNQAIEVLQSAIQTLQAINYQNQAQIAQLYQLLSSYYQKTGNHNKQIECLQKKCQIYVKRYQQGHQKTLRVKKNIAILLQKYGRINQAIKQFEDVLENQEKYYPQNRVQIGKTLKSLGMCYLNIENKLNQAQNMLKRAQKLLSEHGIPRSVKEIKSRLQQIKQKKEGKMSKKQELNILQRQIQRQPIGMAH